MRRILGFSAAVAALTLVHCSDGPSVCEGPAECAAVGTDASSGTGVDGGGTVSPPKGCDVSAEPKDAPPCVVNEYGVFVDGSGGSDANPGTKEQPKKTLGGALGSAGSKPRVYVCAGTYAERLELTTGHSVYGGFACGTWSYDGTRAMVTPPGAGYALTVSKVASSVVLSDLSFRALDGTQAGESSLAGFVEGSAGVTLLRTTLESGAGASGAAGPGGTTGTLTGVSSGALSYAGNVASGTSAGTSKTCTCSSGGTSTGGGGGGSSGGGQAGAPSYGGAAPNDGAGGLGATNCNSGKPNGGGNTGAAAGAAVSGAKVTTLGVLDGSGWTPQSGSAGGNGAPGQGGGGGGGRDGTSAGGGGGCGGCGGTGGGGGGGGGASVALVVHDSAVTLRESTLTAHAAGGGGTGGAPGSGADGGVAGGSLGGCSAGDGGRGGTGGAGSGGAGGVSAAVLYKGVAPVTLSSTLSAGVAGAKGTGGSPGVNDGPDGVARDVLELP